MGGCFLEPSNCPSHLEGGDQAAARLTMLVCLLGNVANLASYHKDDPKRGGLFMYIAGNIWEGMILYHIISSSRMNIQREGSCYFELHCYVADT